MKKFTKLAMLLPIAAVMLTACVATTAYRVGSANYSNRDEAMAASRREDSVAEAAISASAKPLVDRKLLIVIPLASAYLKTWETYVMKGGKQYAPPGTPARAEDDFLADTTVANMKSVASSVKKSNIYRETEVLDIDTTTPNIQPSVSQDVLVLSYWGTDNAQPMIYYFSARLGKQIVAVDMGRSTKAERRIGFIDELKAKALQ